MIRAEGTMQWPIGHGLGVLSQAGSIVTIQDPTSQTTKSQTGGLEGQRDSLRTQGFSEQV